MRAFLKKLFIGQREASSGSISLEAALVLPFILVLAVGTIEFGWVLVQLQAVQSATHVATRMASMSDIVSDGAGGFEISPSAYELIESRIAPIYATNRISDWTTTIDVNSIPNSDGSLNGGKNIFSLNVTSNFVPVSIGLLLVIGINLPTISVNYEVRHAGN